jgi:hypothetical protein
MQAVAPRALAYVPEGHNAQDVDPTELLYMPLRHFAQVYGPPVMIFCDGCKNENEPGRHDRQAIGDVIILAILLAGEIPDTVGATHV